MRKFLILAGLMLSTMQFAGLAAAEDSASKSDSGVKVQPRVDLRMRYENLNNYFDFNSNGEIDTDFDGNVDSGDNFSFVPYRARVGVGLDLPDDVQVVLDIQNFGAWGNQLPPQSFHFPPVQNFDGNGNTSGFRSSDTALYQAYLKLNNMWGSNFSLTLGRQEYEFGTGLILGNEDYYNGTVFDGVKGVWNEEKWSVTGFAFITTERNDFSSGSFSGYGSDDSDLLGAVGHMDIDGKMESNVEAYAVYFHDGLEGNFKPSIYTLGGHWWRKNDTKEDIAHNPWSWNLELAWQTGDITPRLCQGGANDGEICTSDADCVGGTCAIVNDNMGGYVMDGSLGYSFAGEKHTLLVQVGGIMQSGDDDLTDDDVDGWNALYPRTHGRFGDADFFGDNFGGPTLSTPSGLLPINNFGGPIDFSTGFTAPIPASGITALHAGIATNCMEGKHLFDATLWWFGPSEDNIQVSPGNTVHIDHYGTEVDANYQYMYSKHVSFAAGIAYLMPTQEFGSLLGYVNPQNPSQGEDDAVTRFVVEARVRF